jgi:Chalcone isomerase-like
VYDMSFKGREIAERSLAEMRKVGYKDEQKLKRWGEEMTRIFPDVKKGDALIGVSVPGKGAKFYSQEKLIAIAEDAEFAKAFFDIWLSEKTSEPKLREKLLGSQ